MQTTIPALDYQDLDNLLSEQDWEAADRLSADLLRQAVSPDQPVDLDLAAIAHLPCNDLHRLDQLWTHYSGQRFGFSVQQQIYTALECDAVQFSHEVGWTPWTFRPFAFFRFYHQLDFSLEAPRGQFPAFWFWQLPLNGSLLAGGFGSGRGAGYVDAKKLDALILRLERCSLQ
ncbi:MAG: GUN4 domain-containing protein [Leptolyngbyaceae cyanobacterium SM1_1_3]|nr:GUN4 domain-containing protein [Leptolyngbyaceae cyanobacterium SM1_1_3]NJN01435.1 GUN4 domain-containing protein [Leptolyngbyaceae cyanobacterium RM1_1_2]NJO09554.1 GUN4 domain-containing protein [Leptolyngbyaceae cyanobacterium SL_1_1]